MAVHQTIWPTMLVVAVRDLAAGAAMELAIQAGVQGAQAFQLPSGEWLNILGPAEAVAELAPVVEQMVEQVVQVAVAQVAKQLLAPPVLLGDPGAVEVAMLRLWDQQKVAMVPMAL